MGWPTASPASCSAARARRWDLRKAQPYECYADLEFDIPIGKNGDNWDRYLIRMEEMRQSVRIMKQCIERLNSPAGRGQCCPTDHKVTPPRRGGDEDARWKR